MFAQWRGGPMRMAREYQELGKSDSVAQLERIVKQQPNLVPAHFALAQAYLTHQQFPQAEAEFKKVLELQPKSQAARFDLGMTYLSQSSVQRMRKQLSTRCSGKTLTTATGITAWG